MTQAAVEANIRVNGETEPLGIAVALNGAIVPRAAWPQTRLRPGDSVEIVRARQGG